MAVGIVRTIHLNPQILDRLDSRQKELEKTTMAMTFVKKSTLPVLGKGKASEPSVTVTDKGQLTFNPAAAKAFGGLRLAVMGFDSDSRKLQIQAFAKPPKGFEESDCYVIGVQKKSHAAYFSAANLLQSKEYNIGYDYKASGSQSFVPAVDVDKHVILITLPAGALTPRPKQTRNKKTAETPKAAAATVGGLEEVEE